MDNTKSAESAYDLTMEISKVIHQLGVSGDPIELQMRLTELNKQQIENVKKTVLSRFRDGSQEEVLPEKILDDDEPAVFKEQTSLLKRIFNRK